MNNQNRSKDTLLSELEELRRTREDSDRRMREQNAFLECALVVLESRDFTKTARHIFDSFSALIGTKGGYVALLSPDGEENEVLFLESGGIPCSVDPNLPMPIRGLRGEAYRRKEVVWENDFSHSRWMEFMPAGHVRLENVLFAPLIVHGLAVGLLGVANKPGGFNDTDARLARKFGELAARALRNSRDEEIRDMLQSRLGILWELASMKNRNIQELSAYILENLTATTDSPYGFYGFLNEDESVLSIYCWSREAMADCAIGKKKRDFPIAGAGIWAEAIRRRAPIVVNDCVSEVADRMSLPEGHVRISRLLSVPVFDGKRIVALGAVANKAIPYTEDDVNQAGSLLASAQVIAEHRKAEIALQESEDRYRRLFESTIDGVCLHEMVYENGQDYRIIGVNPAYERILGISKDAAVGKLGSELYGSGDPPYIDIYARVAETGVPYEFEVFFEPLDKHFHIAVFSPAKGKFVTVFQDVTARKRAEERLQKSLKEKEVLLSEIHHRVKNNMQVISSLLLSSSIRAENPEFADLVQKTNDRIQTMARIHEQLYQSQDFSGIPMEEYIQKLAGLARHSYGDSAVTVHTEANGIRLPIDQAIPGGLILNELLTNSFKHAFAPKQGGDIQIRMEKEGGGFILRYSDSGTPYNFEIDLENTRTMGMRLIKMLVAQLQGEIFVEQNGGLKTINIRFQDKHGR